MGQRLMTSIKTHDPPVCENSVVTAVFTAFEWGSIVWCMSWMMTTNLSVSLGYGIGVMFIAKSSGETSAADVNRDGGVDVLGLTVVAPAWLGQ
ncbi:MAG: hypothetical protein Kow0031_16120 [Anaerolineae bacterium]